MIGKTRRALEDAPRGVLHRLAEGEFAHWRGAPPPALDATVEHFWSVRWNLDGRPAQIQETLPHPNVHLVVEPGLAAIHGVHTTRFTKLLAGHAMAFGVKFRAGAFRAFLGRPVSQLMDASLPVEAVFADGAAALRELADGASDDEAAAVATRVLENYLPPPDPAGARAGEIVAAIASEPGLRDVASVARHAGLSVRSLQRLFADCVGVSPKWVVNRYRMHEAIARVQQGEPVSWAALAQDLGYFDQAHFIADFRKLVGRTPADYARRYPEGKSAEGKSTDGNSAVGYSAGSDSTEGDAAAMPR